MTITNPSLYQTAYFAWQIIRSNIFYYTWCSLYRRHMSKKFMAISLNFKCCCKQSLSLDKIGLFRVASTLSTVGMSPLDHNFRSVNSVQQLWVGSMSSWELRKCQISCCDGLVFIIELSCWLKLRSRGGTRIVLTMWHRNIF